MLSRPSCVQLFATLWTVARQALVSMGFFRQEYWNGLPFPSLGDLPGPGIKSGSSALQADSLPPSHQGSHNCIVIISEVEICTLVYMCVGDQLVGWGALSCGGGVKRQYCWFGRWKRGHEPRNAVELSRLERAKKQILPERNMVLT